MTLQEQVKMLREAMTRLASVEAIEMPCAVTPEMRARIDLAREVLAATAPPKPYAVDGRDIRVTRTASSWRHVCTFYVDATPEERAAVLDALNALAEKEQAR